jgi:hypothetical protein
MHLGTEVPIIVTRRPIVRLIFFLVGEDCMYNHGIPMFILDANYRPQFELLIIFKSFTMITYDPDTSDQEPLTAALQEATKCIDAPAYLVSEQQLWQRVQVDIPGCLNYRLLENPPIGLKDSAQRECHNQHQALKRQVIWLEIKPLRRAVILDEQSHSQGGCIRTSKGSCTSIGLVVEIKALLKVIASIRNPLD